MRLYTIADSGKGWHWSQHLAFEGVSFVVLVILTGFLISLGEKGFFAALVAAPLLTVAIFWRTLTRDRKSAVAERGRYYCGACSQHFEGDALRQITQ
jgi:amino acid permease